MSYIFIAGGVKVFCIKLLILHFIKLGFITQASGAVPTISVDKTDGCQIYVSGEAVGAQFITAKSSEMNIAVVQENGDVVSDLAPVTLKRLRSMSLTQFSMVFRAMFVYMLQLDCDTREAEELKKRFRDLTRHFLN